MHCHGHGTLAAGTFRQLVFVYEPVHCSVIWFLPPISTKITNVAPLMKAMFMCSLKGEGFIPRQQLIVTMGAHYF